MKPQNQDTSAKFSRAPIEDPIDYQEMKEAKAHLLRQVSKLSADQQPLIVCVGNRAFFNLK